MFDPDLRPELPAARSRRDLVRYAVASGDTNAIHQDDGAARQAGLPGVIAHGMLTIPDGLVLVELSVHCGSDRVLAGVRATVRPPVMGSSDVTGRR